MKDRLWFLVLVCLAAGSALAGNGHSPGYPYIEAKHREALVGKSVMELARMIAHPSFCVSGAVLQELVEVHGLKAVPLMKKLTGDSHMYVRRGAMNVLVTICRNRMKQEGDTPSPETTELTAFIKGLASHDDQVIQSSVASLLGKKGGAADEDTIRTLMAMAGSDDEEVRKSALIGAGRIEDLETKIKIAARAAESGNWGEAVSWSLGKRDDPASQLGLPAAGYYLLNVVSSDPPSRGMHWVSPPNAALALIDHWMSPEIEREYPIVVRGACRSYVRFYPPTSVNGRIYWYQPTQNLLNSIMGKITPESWEAVRQIAQEERAVLDGPDEDLKRRLGVNPWWNEAIDNLDALAEKFSMGEE